MAGKGFLKRFFGILGGLGLSSSERTAEPKGDGRLTTAPGSYEITLEPSSLDALSQAELDASRQQARLDRIQESMNMDESFGINTGLMHLSALDRTTRLAHAKRHGKVFSKEQAMAFFEDPKNYQGCTCRLVVVLLESDGRPVLTEEMKQRHADEFAAWQKARRWKR